MCEFVGRKRRLSARLLLWFAIVLLTVVVSIGGKNFYTVQAGG